MITSYHVSPRDKPYLIVFTAPTLEQVAESITAQPDPDALRVYASTDGFSRELREDERARLAELRA